MAKIEEQVQFIAEEELQKKLSFTKVNKASKKAANEAIKIIRERTIQGIGLDGKRLPKLTKEYAFRKRTKLSKLQKGKGSLTKWAARSSPNHIRLTGQLFTAMKYKIIKMVNKKNKFEVVFELYFKGDQDKKVEWLASTKGRNKYKSYIKASRVWFGISTNPNRRAKELKRLNKVYLRELGLSGNVSVV